MRLAEIVYTNCTTLVIFPSGDNLGRYDVRNFPSVVLAAIGIRELCFCIPAVNLYDSSSPPPAWLGLGYWCLIGEGLEHTPVRVISGAPGTGSRTANGASSRSMVMIVRGLLWSRCGSTSLEHSIILGTTIGVRDNFLNFFYLVRKPESFRLGMFNPWTKEGGTVACR